MKATHSFFGALAPSLAISATFASLALFSVPAAVAQEFELIVPDATRESCATLGGYMKKGECRVRTTISDNTDELIRVEAESVGRDDYLASEIGRVEGQSIATDNDQNAEIGRVEGQSLATDEAQNARMDATDASFASWRNTVNDHSLNIINNSNKIQDFSSKIGALETSQAAQDTRMDAADESAAQWRKTVNEHSLNILNNSNKISALEAETAYVYDDLAPRLYVKSNGERLGELVPFPFNHWAYHAVTPQGYLFLAFVSRDDEGKPFGRLATGGHGGHESYGYDNPSCLGQPLFRPSLTPLIEDTVGMIFFTDQEEMFYANYGDGVVTDFYVVNRDSGECIQEGSSNFVMPAYRNEPAVTGIPFFTRDIPQPSIGW